MSRRAYPALSLALAALFATVPVVAYATNEVPASKRTVLGKYLSAKEAHERIAVERAKVLFLDVRTMGELMFVGGAEEVDAVVPFAEIRQPTVWDDKAGRLAMAPNPSFVPSVDAALAKKGLSKTDPVLVMCRSGDRSSRAVNTLAAAGYTDVWSVYDGFEGDVSKDGRRSVNGWKNAGLPWSYTLDKAKFTFAAAPK